MPNPVDVLSAILLTPFCMLSKGEGEREVACNGDFYWLYERSGHI